MTQKEFELVHLYRKAYWSNIYYTEDPILPQIHFTETLTLLQNTPQEGLFCTNILHDKTKLLAGLGSERCNHRALIDEGPVQL